MKIGALCWSGNNIGDDIQTVAVAQHLPPIDVFIHRDRLNTYDGPETLLVLNGWFLDEVDNWPPSDPIKPIFFGFHVQKHARGTVAKHAEYLKRHEPIGCRDRGTTEFIRSLGVEAYLSYCATLTFNPPAQRSPDSIYYVEAELRLFGDAKNFKRLKVKSVSHRFIDVSWETRFAYAKEIVETYGRSAKYVITSRIHCAMPCAAMGIPTMFVGPDNYRTRIIDEVGIPRAKKPDFWSKIRGTRGESQPQQIDLSEVKSRITSDLDLHQLRSCWSRQEMKIAKMSFAALVFFSRFGFRDINWKAWRTITVYPRLGIAYNRIRKNANTTTIYLLREIESGEVETQLDAKKRPRKFTSTTYSNIWALRKSTFLVIVRNPYSRVLSAFLDKFRKESYKRLHGEYDLTPSGFEAFVIWLENGGITRDKHWDLQTKHMFLPLSAFDTVVRFENLKPELLAFLDSQGLAAPQGRLDHFYPTDVWNEKKTSADAKLNAFYTPRAIEIVARLYAEDFRALGYSMAFPSARGNAEIAGDAFGVPMRR